MSDISSDNLMIRKLPPGKYVVAVSGGVDSMVLLDILSRQPNLVLIVAHFDHGIRNDSASDEKLVRETCVKRGLTYELGQGKLGQNASEEKARIARYKFLESIKTKHRADAIVTAHHQDDLIETAIINVLRGSNRRGLSSLLTNKNVLRPLAKVRKPDLINYAKNNDLIWHEDYTNADIRYLRNYIRKHLDLYKSPKKQNALIINIDKVAKLNKELDAKLATLSHKIMDDAKIDRSLFTLLPPNIAKELLIYWLKGLEPVSYDTSTIERLYIKLKTAPHQTKHEVNGKWWLVTDKDIAYFSNNRVGSLI